MHVGLWILFASFAMPGIFQFGWVYDISTIVGYLMPNPFYTYILNI